MHRKELLQHLKHHRTHFNDEAAYLARAIDFVENHEDCFERHHWHGHVTGSTWVVNPSRDHVLMLHHRKHDQWFQPGGHADGDGDILRVALRETSEETGLEPDHIRLVNDNVFDVDVHAIPEVAGDPPHVHFDVRFLVEIDDQLPLPGNDESHQVGWVALNEVARFNNSRSTYRMVEKTRRMRTNRTG